jgi:hypothetical protein
MFEKTANTVGLRSKILAATAIFAVFGLGQQALADSGFYLGGSVGDATLAVTIVDEAATGVFEFDESDFAWKAFAGYKFDLPIIKLGIEGGYVDLGNPEAVLLDSTAGLAVTAWDAFGTAGFGLGPVELFAKVGVISWDAKATLDGISEGGDDGTDPAYGIGLSVAFSSLEIRAEYELFDVSDVDDLYMLSAGLVWRF